MATTQCEYVLQQSDYRVGRPANHYPRVAWQQFNRHFLLSQLHDEMEKGEGGWERDFIDKEEAKGGETRNSLQGRYIPGTKLSEIVSRCSSHFRRNIRKTRPPNPVLVLRFMNVCQRESTAGVPSWSKAGTSALALHDFSLSVKTTATLQRRLQSSIFLHHTKSVVVKRCKKEQVRQCLGFCTADS